MFAQLHHAYLTKSGHVRLVTKIDQSINTQYFGGSKVFFEQFKCDLMEKRHPLTRVILARELSPKNCYLFQEDFGEDINTELVVHAIGDTYLIVSKS